MSRKRAKRKPENVGKPRRRKRHAWLVHARANDAANKDGKLAMFGPVTDLIGKHQRFVYVDAPGSPGGRIKLSYAAYVRIYGGRAPDGNMANAFAQAEVNKAALQAARDEAAAREQRAKSARLQDLKRNALSIFE